ncbi:hypothetical protein D3C80_2181050 [compost metagenome]
MPLGRLALLFFTPTVLFFLALTLLFLLLPLLLLLLALAFLPLPLLFGLPLLAMAVIDVPGEDSDGGKEQG